MRECSKKFFKNLLPKQEGSFFSLFKKYLIFFNFRDEIYWDPEKYFDSIKGSDNNIKCSHIIKNNYFNSKS